VLVLAAPPAAGNFPGGVAAELPEVSDRVLPLALHLAAGIVTAVIGLELMPEALAASVPWVPIAAFVGGGALFMAWRSSSTPSSTATALTPSLGLLLALGQVPADAPEGLAAIAALRAAGIPRRTRVLMALGFAAPMLIGASLDCVALRQAPNRSPSPCWP
jgi:ZIP family zinc transporter